MQFSTLSILLLAADIASAARFTQKRWERHAAARGLSGSNSRNTSLRLPPTNSTGHALDDEGVIELDDQPQVKNAAINKVYSQNWAGSILIGNGYTAVTGTFVVPSPSVPVGGSSSTEVRHHLDFCGILRAFPRIYVLASPY